MNHPVVPIVAGPSTLLMQSFQQEGQIAVIIDDQQLRKSFENKVYIPYYHYLAGANGRYGNQISDIYYAIVDTMLSNLDEDISLVDFVNQNLENVNLTATVFSDVIAMSAELTQVIMDFVREACVYFYMYMRSYQLLRKDTTYVLVSIDISYITIMLYDEKILN